MKTPILDVIVTAPICSVRKARERAHAERLEQQGVPAALAARSAQKIILVQDIENAESVDTLRGILLRLVDQVYRD
jgi:hypothetical protein